MLLLESNKQEGKEAQRRATVSTNCTRPPPCHYPPSVTNFSPVSATLWRSTVMAFPRRSTMSTTTTILGLLPGTFQPFQFQFLHVTLTLLLFSLLPQQSVSSGGRFSIKLNSFTNPQGLLDNSLCCNDNCSSPCSTRFRVCIKNYQISIDSNGPCYIGEANSIPINSNTVNELQWDFEFKFRWPGTFSLIIEAWNVIDNGQHQITGLIARMAMQQWLSIDTNWRARQFKTPLNQTFNYSYRVVCLNNYYGEECDRYCKQRDDKFGHYNCSENGDILCQPGWSGEYCMEATCNPPCLHGTCTAPNSCSCSLGYMGPQCSQCQTYPGCKHGSCTIPWQCDCDEGWGGLFCNQDLNYCTNHKPCKNDGICFNTGQGSYTCSCTGGWTGVDCSGESNGNCTTGGDCGTSRNGDDENKKICGENFTCLNGGTCSSGVCLCPPSTLAPDCRRPFCSSSPCPNGATCMESSKSCICPDGTTGPLCQNPSASSSPSTSSSCNCFNDATCQNNTCLCKPEWSGPDCSIANATYTLSLLKEVETELSMEHIILVIMVSVAFPVLIIIAVSLVIMFKRRRDKERRREDEIVRLQNDENDGKLVVVNKFKESNLWKNSDGGGGGGGGGDGENKMRCPPTISGGQGLSTLQQSSLHLHSPSIGNHQHHQQQQQQYCNNYLDPGSTTPYLTRSNSHDLFKSSNLNNLSLANLNMTQV